MNDTGYVRMNGEIQQNIHPVCDAKVGQSSSWEEGKKWGSFNF